MRGKADFGFGRCLYCGEVFKRTGAAHSYCSTECRDAAYAESINAVDEIIKNAQPDEVDGWRACAICGKFFKPDCPRTKYCSPACVSEAKNLGKVRRRKEKIMRQARKKPERPPAPKTDGFTWADIRKVFAELGITSYHKALAILEQRRKEAKEND